MNFEIEEGDDTITITGDGGASVDFDRGTLTVDSEYCGFGTRVELPLEFTRAIFDKMLQYYGTPSIVMKSMDTAPKDGSRILLYHVNKDYKNESMGKKWMDVRWRSPGSWSSTGRWEAYTGNDKSYSTDSVQPEDCLGYMDIPK